METLLTSLDRADGKDGKATPSMEEHSIQYNRQDLDQEQNCDVSPIQLNNQKIHIHLRTEKSDLSSKITGVTLFEYNRQAAPNTCVELFWGHESMHPVCKMRSDENGNFSADDLPPGFYTINAYLESGLHYRSVIKVLPSQNAYHCVLLRA